MDAKTHYEEYWAKNKGDNFFEYERNLILPKLFDKKEKVLDLGCGDGAVAQYLEKELGNRVTGADISHRAVVAACKRGVKAVYVDAEKELPFKPSSFDSVFWGDNVEHLFDPHHTLMEIKKVLTKKGRLVMSCPNMGYWRYRLHYLFLGALPDTEWTGNPPWGWSHIRFFNQSIIEQFLKSAGFNQINFYGINRRFPDKYLVRLSPGIFGMIIVVEAKKNG